MLTLQQPATEKMRELLIEQSGKPLSYPWQGETVRARMPDGFYTISFSRRLGRGEQAFSAAVQALSQWNSFRLPWSRLVFDGKPETGNHLAVAFRVNGIWSLNCSRVVAHDPCVTNAEVWSYTLGTLPRHVLEGEEKISVTLDSDNGDVCYEIRSFSRPSHWLTRLALPWVRRQQHRFCTESYLAMDRYLKAERRFPMPALVRNASDQRFPAAVLKSRSLSSLDPGSDERG